MGVLAAYDGREALRTWEREDAAAVAGTHPFVYLNPDRYAEL